MACAKMQRNSTSFYAVKFPNLLLLLLLLLLFSKMASFTPQEKVQCCYWLAEFKFPVTVQRRFRDKYGREAPDRHTIVQWHKHLLENGDFRRHGGGGRRRTSDENVEAIREAFTRSPRKSVKQASRQLHLRRSAIHDVLHKRLKLTAHKIQLVQKLQLNDKAWRFNYAVDILSRVDEDNKYLNNVIFSDEATFHVSGYVNRHNCRIWGSENSHVFLEHERNSKCLLLINQLRSDRTFFLNGEHNERCGISRYAITFCSTPDSREIHFPATWCSPSLLGTSR
ncbi:hypothetical protein C0J52_24031 [Blattella germanica]|nr:hypothetical protein C0J52_24031 [Blattella germanica]